MNRQECESKIIGKLEEIRDLVHEYEPKINQVNMCILSDQVWAFSLAKDEDGEPITGDYLLDALKIFKEEEKYAG